MKKIVLFAALMVATLTASAQEAGKMAFGANFNYGMHKDYKNIGFGAKFQYNITDAIRGEASGNYFLKKDNLSMWDVNLNAHYVVNLSEGLNIYPLAGLTIVGAKLDVDGAFKGSFEDFCKDNGVSAADLATLQQLAPEQYNGLKAQYDALKNDASGNSSETKVGFNIGGGIEYFISDNLKVNAEIKYQYVKDFDRPVISAGIAYVF